jgi:hypothetical protein
MRLRNTLQPSRDGKRGLGFEGKPAPARTCGQIATLNRAGSEFAPIQGCKLCIVFMNSWPLAHRRVGGDPGRGWRHGPRDRRQVGLGHDDLVREGRVGQARPALYLPADRARLRGSDLHRLRHHHDQPRRAVVTETFGATVAELRARVAVTLRAPSQTSGEQ